MDESEYARGVRKQACCNSSGLHRINVCVEVIVFVELTVKLSSSDLELRGNFFTNGDGVQASD